MYATRQTHQNLALFDFDGTLCRQDSFTGFIFYALKKRHIVRQGLKILPQIQAYYRKRYPADQMRQTLFYTMFKDQDATSIQTIANEYAQSLIGTLDSALLIRLKAHQARGDRVALVSASLDLYLKPLCDYLDIDLICTQPQIRQSKLTGHYQTPDCSAEQKSLRVQAAYDLTQFANIYAYGNSHEDEALLALADYPFMLGRDLDLPPLVLKSA
ncbi:HAD-IB family phosphatase [Acinetobacter sp. B51(2017)]|uniref:HAD-IB family phosphatase n=1 Tax=Acinetobacter sp. B51(2017) TaxID=2060938 RepID=UPI000F07BA8B|nr:HAD-IB family phosphatase [Acinetobacter sp. B51(2017)]